MGVGMECVPQEHGSVNIMTHPQPCVGCQRCGRAYRPRRTCHHPKTVAAAHSRAMPSWSQGTPHCRSPRTVLPPQLHHTGICRGMFTRNQFWYEEFRSSHTWDGEGTVRSASKAQRPRRVNPQTQPRWASFQGWRVGVAGAQISFPKTP